MEKKQNAELETLMNAKLALQDHAELVQHGRVTPNDTAKLLNEIAMRLHNVASILD